MGWKNGKYYHRSKRVGDRVTSEYVGSGYTAMLAAQLDQHERQKTRQRRAALKELQKREAALDQQIDQIGATLEAIVAALLLTNGYHQHHRQWRKERK